MKVEEIQKKISAGEPITREENIYYLVNAMGYTQDQAENIIAIAENTDTSVIID